MQEEWKPIFEGHYEVSNRGRVRNAQNERILRGTLDSTGYLHTNLALRPMKPRAFQTHRLVAMAFVPNPDNKPCVNHKDGNKTNNLPENLEWCTQAENIQHAVWLGLARPEIRDMRTKRLPDDTVREIRKLFEVGKSNKSIARKFGISPKTTRRIEQGRYYAYVP